MRDNTKVFGLEKTDQRRYYMVEGGKIMTLGKECNAKINGNELLLKKRKMGTSRERM